MKKVVELLRRVPWTPILLFLLVSVTFLEWRATVKLSETVSRCDVDLIETRLRVEGIENRLEGVSQDVKQIKADTHCLRPGAPPLTIGCR